jgi:N-acetylglucosamine repressor
MNFVNSMDKASRSPKKATHQLTKQHNRDLVLRAIFEHGEISRASISRLTQLTRTTVSDVVSSLLSEGLVEEAGRGSSIGGKPSILLRLVANSHYLVGVNLAQHRFVASVVNLRGEISETVEAQVPDNDGKNAIRLIYQVLDRLVGKSWRPLVGIGVGAPGLINTRAGVVIDAVNLDWRDLPLARLLEERYGIPARILNDSQATAIGEFVYGEHRADDNLIVVNVSHGIGAGILVNGRLFQGDGGGAGEIGHVLVAENGLPCRCGRRGCLETLASGRAILERARQLPGLSNVTSLEMVAARFDAGDPAVRDIVLDAGRRLGLAVAAMVSVLNIEKIILTGDVTRFGEPWLDEVRGAMTRAALGRLGQETRLEFGKLDYRACVLGASAYLLLDDYSLLFPQKEN